MAESRVTGVISAVPRYTGSLLFNVLEDGAELGGTCLHDQQVLRDMFEVMVRQQVFMAVT